MPLERPVLSPGYPTWFIKADGVPLCQTPIGDLTLAALDEADGILNVAAHPSGIWCMHRHEDDARRAVQTIARFAPEIALTIHPGPCDAPRPRPGQVSPFCLPKGVRTFDDWRRYRGGQEPARARD